MQFIVLTVLQRWPANLSKVVEYATGIVRTVARVKGWEAACIEDAKFVGANANYRGVVVAAVGQDSIRGG